LNIIVHDQDVPFPRCAIVGIHDDGPLHLIMHANADDASF